MEILWQGLSAFLQAVGVTALVYLASWWFLRERENTRAAVRIVLCGDCPELESLLRSLRDWQVILLDGGLTPEGRTRARLAARNEPHITWEEEHHGGEDDH